MDRHVIGSEVQTVMADADWFRQQHGQQSKVGVCGYGEGGLIAFYAAEANPEIACALGAISVFSVASCSITEYLSGKQLYETARVLHQSSRLRSSHAGRVGCPQNLGQSLSWL